MISFILTMIGYFFIFYAVDYKRTKEAIYGAFSKEWFVILMLVLIGVIIIIIIITAQNFK